MKRRFAISDIHGCINTFFALLIKIDFNTGDKLFLLGDYIDRGPYSIETLDYLVDLKENNKNVKFIRGSHEELFLLFVKNRNITLVKNMLDKGKYSFKTFENKIEKKHIDFIEGLPYYIEDDDFIFVHAGLNFLDDNPFDDLDAMVWINDWEYDAKKVKHKTIIHGHKPISIDEITRNLKEKNKKICIDNDCTSLSEGFGNMVCLNIDTLELFIQPKID